MSRAGGNSGKGSRNYRLNWKDWPDVSTFGDWKLCPDERGLHWYVWHRGCVVLRSYGLFSGRLRLSTREAAKRWVEKHLRSRRAA